MSALDGDNVTLASDRMAWYAGPTLLSHLETVNVGRDTDVAEFRLPVQWVNRPNLDFRGFSGTIASGSVKPGDEVINLPSGKRSEVKSIVTYKGELSEAVVDQAVTLTLADEIDISRGDVICGVDGPAEQSDQFAAHIIWMSEKALFPGRQYRIKTNNQTIHASITTLKHKINVNTLVHEAANTLELNEIGVCNIGLAKPVVFDAYKNNRQLGSARTQIAT